MQRLVRHPNHDLNPSTVDVRNGLRSVILLQLLECQKRRNQGHQQKSEKATKTK